MAGLEEGDAKTIYDTVVAVLKEKGVALENMVAAGSYGTRVMSS